MIPQAIFIVTSLAHKKAYAGGPLPVTTSGEKNYMLFVFPDGFPLLQKSL